MNNSMKDVSKAIENELAGFALNLIRKPKTEKEPSRINLYIIGASALGILTLLDFIAAVVVGMLTNPLYGLLVFVIGVGALAVAELGFFFSYASWWQKALAIWDGVIGIGSTLMVGIAAAVLYAFKAFEIVDIGNWGIALEIGTVVTLVIIGVIHAINWISYVVIDEGVKMVSNYQQSRARNKIEQQTLALSQQSMETNIQMANSMMALVKENKGELLREQIKQLTGQDLLGGVDFDALRGRSFASDTSALELKIIALEEENKKLKNPTDGQNVK